jgi:hypothetical protein
VSYEFRRGEVALLAGVQGVDIRQDRLRARLAALD